MPGFFPGARENIAVPDDRKGQIVFKWPDQNIRKFSRAIVEPDAVAVFTSQGQIMGVLPPGQHTLDAKELPFLGMFVDWASGGNAFKAEIYFVGTREFVSLPLGTGIVMPGASSITSGISRQSNSEPNWPRNHLFRSSKSRSLRNALLPT